MPLLLHYLLPHVSFEVPKRLPKTFEGTKKQKSFHKVVIIVTLNCKGVVGKLTLEGQVLLSK